MMNSSKYINSHNSRDEWALALVAVALPIVALLSTTL